MACTISSDISAACWICRLVMLTARVSLFYNLWNKRRENATKYKTVNPSWFCHVFLWIRHIVYFCVSPSFNNWVLHAVFLTLQTLSALRISNAIKVLIKDLWFCDSVINLPRSFICLVFRFQRHTMIRNPFRRFFPSHSKYFIVVFFPIHLTLKPEVAGIYHLMQAEYEVLTKS